MTNLRKVLGTEGILPTHARAPYRNAVAQEAIYFIFSLYEHPSEGIDNRLETLDAKEIAKKLHILERITDTAMLLGRQCIALRGHRDDMLHLSKGESTINRGNFWAVLEHQGKVDPVLRHPLTCAPKNAKYTQENVINVVETMIRNKVHSPYVLELCPSMM